MNYNFDLSQIEQDVAKVLSYSQGFCDPSDLNGIHDIIQDWLCNKSDFITHMNGDLIYQYPQQISFELDEDAKLERLSRFIGIVETHYDNIDLACFLNMIKVSDFYNNKTSLEYRVRTEYGQNIVIPQNYKVVKAFKFFEKNEDLLKQLQSEASRIIQENVVSGHLCFSVHPLDFLSISENVHNWRSCHSLDGEYRSGNLNYLVDSTTVVCYLKADKQAILPHFPEDVLWNSKKWRVLLFFSNDRTLVFAGRQYPFTANHGIEMIRENILPELMFGNWTKWNDTTISTYQDNMSKSSFFFKPMMPLGDSLQRVDQVIKDGANTHQFNDLLRSSIYSPIWSYRKKISYWGSPMTGCSSDDTFVAVGKECKCPICGTGTVEFDNTMCCSNCADDYGYEYTDYCECEICNSMTHEQDMVYLDFSGLRVCPDCFEREVVRCQECGLYDLPDVIKHHQGDSRCLCPGCWEDASRTLDLPVKLCITKTEGDE